MKYNRTVQRRVIIEELSKVKTHPTAEEIFQMVRQKLPRISLGTIYRNLDKLSENHDILRLETAGRQLRYDYNVENHLHLRCEHCGRIEDINAADSDHILNQLNDFSKKNNFSGFQLEFYGSCKHCLTQEMNSIEANV